MNVFIHRFQQPVQSPGGWKEKNGRKQVNHRTDAKLKRMGRDVVEGDRGFHKHKFTDQIGGERGDHLKQIKQAGGSGDYIDGIHFSFQ